MAPRRGASQGQDVIEYALIVALVVVVAAVAMRALGDEIASVMEILSGWVSSAAVP